MAVDGTWKIKLSTPMGERDGTMSLAADGAALSGTFDGPQGQQEVEGSADGDAIKLKADVTGPMGAMTIEWDGAVEGDSISGTVKFGTFGEGSFTGTRA
jgi:hypothetical protein